MLMDRYLLDLTCWRRGTLLFPRPGAMIYHWGMVVRLRPRRRGSRQASQLLLWWSLWVRTWSLHLMH